MKWTPSPDWLVDAFDDLVPARQDVERRKMFGYPCAFAGGNMFIGLHQDRLVLRLPDGERDSFLERYDSELFTPFPGRTMREYVVVPHSLIAKPGELSPWIDKSHAYAGSLEPRKRKASKRSKKKADA